MDAGQLAALIAAGSFAVLACVAVFVLVRVARLTSAATTLVTEYRGRADLLIEQAQEAVDRTNAQLARTDAITVSMDQVTSTMAELSGHVAAVTGLARVISAAATAPLTGMSAFAFGLRRAVLVRHSLQAAAAAQTTADRAEQVAGRPAVLSTGGTAVRPARRAIAGARAYRPAGKTGTQS